MEPIKLDSGSLTVETPHGTVCIHVDLTDNSPLHRPALGVDVEPRIRTARNDEDGNMQSFDNDLYKPGSIALVTYHYTDKKFRESQEEDSWQARKA
jgi:hypothetical protein